MATMTTSTPAPASALAKFETFIAGSTEPALRTLSSDHDDSTSGSPANQVLALLPKSSLLALRVVSRATKTWTETLETSVFATLHIDFPVPELLSTNQTALHRISQKCQRLTVSILGTTPDLDHFRDLPGQSILPAFPVLTYLRVIPPASETLDPLLVFRIFLQSALVPQLKHIAIDNLNLDGVLAMRWGPFTSFYEGAWGSSKVWRGINVIELKLIPWWENEPRSTGPRAYTETCPTCGETNIEIESGTQRRQRKIEKGEERAGIKILHDWLKSFESNSMEKIMIEWTRTTESQRNPLLLDEFAAKDGKGRWFSAPPIRWINGCKEVWLGGVLVRQEDLEAMVERMQGLEKVMVWRGWLGPRLTGRRSEVAGREWVGVDIKEHKIIMEKEKEWTAKMERELPSREKKLVIKVVKTNRSVPELLEDDTKMRFEGTLENGMRFEGTLEEEEDETDLSDDSMEVPVFLLQDAQRNAGESVG